MDRVAWLPLFLFVLVLGGCSGRPEPVAQAGVIDLSSWDLASPTGLNGEWVFAPADLTTPGTTLAARPPGFRSVPDLWSDREAGGERGQGGATYHLSVRLPASSPPLALRYFSASTALRLEANGVTILEVGHPSSDPAQARAAFLPGTVRLPEVEGDLELTLRVSNYVYRVGGLWYPWQLGTVGAVEGRWLADIALALGHAVALATIGTLLLVLFVLRPSDRLFLFAALLAWALALRGLVTGDYLLARFWPDIPFEALIRLEYLTVYLCFPVAIELFPALTPGVLPRVLVRVLRGLAWVFVAQVFVLPLEWLTRSIFAFYAFAGAAVVIFLYALVVEALQKHGRYARLMLLGGLTLALSVFNDVLYSSFFLQTTNLGTWGFLFFILVLVWTVFERFTLAFSEVENLVSQKDTLLLEIHHRVRNNLQSMAGLVSLQAKRLVVPEAREAMAALRTRILTMGLVQEKLYQSARDNTLDLGVYLNELMDLLVPRTGSSEGMRVLMEIEPRERSAELCTTLGLIVAELVNNAWKHVLRKEGGGHVTLVVRGDEKNLILLVEDDGPGFPPEFQPDRRKTLGFQLIDNLAARYRGGWEILPGPGGRVQVTLQVG